MLARLGTSRGEGPIEEGGPRYVRNEVIHREGRGEAEKVEVDSTRVSIGGDNREGEGGRDRMMGEEEGGAGRCGVTPTESVWDVVLPQVLYSRKVCRLHCRS